MHAKQLVHCLAQIEYSINASSFFKPLYFNYFLSDKFLQIAKCVFKKHGNLNR